MPISLCLDGKAEDLTNRQLGGMDMQPRATQRCLQEKGNHPSFRNQSGEGEQDLGFSTTFRL